MAYIAIDGRFIGTIKTGTSSYSEHIVWAISQIDSKNQYFLLRSNGHIPFIDQINFTEITCEGSIYMNPIWEQITLPTMLETLQCKIYFAPTGICPIASCAANVVTIYDIGFEHFPQFYEDSLLQYLKKWIPVACASAGKILAISEFTKNDLMETYKLASDRVDVVYPSYGPQFKPIKDDLQIHRVRLQYGIYRDYIMTVTSGGANKNIEGALHALAVAKKKIGRPFPLDFVVVGFPKGAPAQLLDLVTELDLQEQVLFVGYVNDEDMPVLYSAARVFVFSSLFEGFGLPPLEAMACGCPVVCSNKASLPEVIADAGLHVYTQDNGQFSDVLYDMLVSEKLRAQYSVKGLVRSSLFSWQNSARKLLSIFEKL